MTLPVLLEDEVVCLMSRNDPRAARRRDERCPIGLVARCGV